MSKNLILIIGILFLLAVAGCDGSKKDKRPITDIDIRKGTNGLLTEFLPNTPPESVFEENEFTISLKLKNAGAFDIVENKETPEIEKGIVVFGFEKAYIDVLQEKFVQLSVDELKAKSLDELRGLVPDFEILSNEDLEKFSIENRKKYLQQLINLNENFKKGSIFEIKGKSIYSPLGDEDFVTIEAEAKKIGVQSEKHPTTIFATACYPYNTVLGTSVCIDPDITGQEKGQKACVVKDMVFSDGQGAPVAVTKVETRILPQQNDKIKPHFLINVKNAGNGEIVNVNNFSKACTSEELDYKEFFNTIIVSASLSGMPLKCNGKEIPGDPMRVMVTLRKGSGSILTKSEDLIRCTLEEDLNDDGNPDDLNNDGKQDIELINSGADAYVAPLKVELEYGYTFTISKNIIIEKILTH